MFRYIEVWYAIINFQNTYMYLCIKVTADRNHWHRNG